MKEKHIKRNVAKIIKAISKLTNMSTPEFIKYLRKSQKRLDARWEEIINEYHKDKETGIKP